MCMELCGLYDGGMCAGVDLFLCLAWLYASLYMCLSIRVPLCMSGCLTVCMNVCMYVLYVLLSTARRRYYVAVVVGLQTDE
jgi:hypothetical protein